MPRREPGLRATPEAFVQAVEVLRPTPVPGLGPGLGAMPRFRAEVGPFIGFAGSMDVRSVDGGYVPAVADDGCDRRRRPVAARGPGPGRRDRRVGRRAGVRLDRTARRHRLDPRPAGVVVRRERRRRRVGRPVALRHLHPRCACRSTWCRATCCCSSPMYLFSPDDLHRHGGHRQQRRTDSLADGWATRIGRFQFVLGRELGATFYGYGLREHDDRAAGARPGEPTVVVDFKSIHFDLPILEYRPYRAFDTKQSSAIAGPALRRRRRTAEHHGDLAAGGAGVKLDTIYSIGVRLIFDWRRYY